jgi:hypothetical protein
VQSRVERRQITLDATVDFCEPLLELAAGEILVVGVDRFELAAVDGDDCVSE